jgi:hypothetical protein
MPKPNAQPVYFSLSIPTASKTFGSTMPQPAISFQLSLPSLSAKSKSISALGSVKGKKLGLPPDDSVK